MYVGTNILDRDIPVSFTVKVIPSSCSEYYHYNVYIYI